MTDNPVTLQKKLTSKAEHMRPISAKGAKHNETQPHTRITHRKIARSQDRFVTEHRSEWIETAKVIVGATLAVAATFGLFTLAGGGAAGLLVGSFLGLPAAPFIIGGVYNLPIE